MEASSLFISDELRLEKFEKTPFKIEEEKIISVLKSYRTALVIEFLRLPTTMATSSFLAAAPTISTASTPLPLGLAAGMAEVTKVLGGMTKPLLISESVRSANLLLSWFFFELFLDNRERPKEAKLEVLLSLLSVLLNCFCKYQRSHESVKLHFYKAKNLTWKAETGTERVCLKSSRWLMVVMEEQLDSFESVR